MFNTNDLKQFEKIYNTAHEDKAINARGNFIKKFPLKDIGDIRLKDYVIGTGRETFCSIVEAKSKEWANILGATALKFGIYYGVTNTDKTQKYRFSEKFGRNEKEAFRNVKSALIKLIDAGSRKDFEKIDKNPISQMFKAKILSLYFPETYLNVCGTDHILQLAEEFGFDDDLWVSECQHLLRKKKDKYSISMKWSLPKFMAFLFYQYYKKNVFTGKY